MKLGKNGGCWEIWLMDLSASQQQDIIYIYIYNNKNNGGCSLDSTGYKISKADISNYDNVHGEHDD